MKQLFDELSQHCSVLTTRKYSTSFSMGILCLSPKVRQHIYAIYGFVRLADEIVDSFHEYPKEELLKRFEEDTWHAIQNGISLNPVLNSFQHTVRAFNIDENLIRHFLKSMRSDLQQKSYVRDEYENYIYGSAEVVGLMCLYVFVDGNKKQFEALEPFAKKLGSAFQKVNFLRDIQHDYKTLGRVYFPNAEMSNFSAEMKIEIEYEIEKEFESALMGIKQLPESSKHGVYLAYKYYRNLFKKIKDTSSKDVLKKRIRISNTHKAGLLLNSLMRARLNLL